MYDGITIFAQCTNQLPIKKVHLEPMLEYDWGNPSPIMFTGSDSDDPTHQSNPQTRPVFDLYSQQTFNEPLINQTGFNPQTHHYHPPAYDPRAYCSMYDPRANGSCYPPPPPPHPDMISFEPAGPIFPTGFIKSEPGGSSRIGLNLGGRTYFSSSEDYFVNRLCLASRPVESGSVNSPRCQAEGCNADLTDAKHYHRRHKVCEFHSKASTVVASGLTQRFCQQCSRFHLLSEFDNGKRSCRKRLADHNRRRRKSQRPNHQDHNNKSSSSETIPRSPPDSGAQSSSSVTAALSPPRISLDCFGQRSYQSTTTSSASTSSLFFSNG